MTDRLDLRDATQGVSPRFCENCGQRPHQHEKEREAAEDGRYTYNYYCSEDGQ